MAIFKKTIDSILSGINKNIEELNAFAANERATAADEYAKAHALADAASDRNAAAARAASVAGKLEQLIAG